MNTSSLRPEPRANTKNFSETFHAIIFQLSHALLLFKSQYDVFLCPHGNTHHIARQTDFHIVQNGFHHVLAVFGSARHCERARVNVRAFAIEGELGETANTVDARINISSVRFFFHKRQLHAFVGHLHAFDFHLKRVGVERTFVTDDAKVFANGGSVNILRSFDALHISANDGEYSRFGSRWLGA